jgi:hypothetical protein
MTSRHTARGEPIKPKGGDIVMAENKDMANALQEFLANADPAEILRVLGTVKEAAKDAVAYVEEREKFYKDAIAALREQRGGTEVFYSEQIKNLRAERDAETANLETQISDLREQARAEGIDIKQRGRKPAAA